MKNYVIYINGFMLDISMDLHDYPLDILSFESLTKLLFVCSLPTYITKLAAV